jgi:anti-sigma regulatory factor (Ser/Thr protein kinase)
VSADDDTVLFRVSASADVVAAALQMTRHAVLRGASATERSLVATIVSELGSNIVKYARRGTLCVSRHAEGDAVDVEVFAEDEGPGIADVERAMRDHFSTGGTLGLGLPGVRRMVDRFELHSAPGAGTKVLARKRIIDPPEAEAQAPAFRSVAPRLEERPRASVRAPQLVADDVHYELGARLRHCEGHAVSGDRALSLRCEGGLLLGIIDASGHGPSADVLAARLETLFLTEGSADLPHLMLRFDETLRGTSGAAAGLVFVDEPVGTFRYLGVGNTRAAQIGNRPWRGISRDGVLGGRAMRQPLQTGTLDVGDLLVMWTDGLPEAGCTSLARASAYRPVHEIATTLITQLARPYDDAACLVLRWHG